LHRIEFTWFHYSRTVLAFCCTGPQLTLDGCYPLYYSTMSGLSYPNTIETIRQPTFMFFILNTPALLKRGIFDSFLYAKPFV
jgi:hypothetical protein